MLQKSIIVDGASLDDQKQHQLSRLRVKKKRIANKAAVASSNNGSEQSTEEDIEEAEKAYFDDPDDGRVNDEVVEERVEETERDIQMSIVVEPV